MTFSILMRGDISFLFLEPDETLYLCQLVGFSHRSSLSLFVALLLQISCYVCVQLGQRAGAHLLYCTFTSTVQRRAAALIGSQQSLVAKQAQCTERQKHCFVLLPACSWHFRHQ